MHNADPLCRSRQRYIQRPHALPFFGHDARWFNDQHGVDFEALHQLHRYDGYSPVET